MGKSAQRELASRMAVLRAHLLKWKYQSDRNRAIKATYACGEFTIRDIGDSFGLHDSRIRQIIRDAPAPTGEAHVKT